MQEKKEKDMEKGGKRQIALAIMRMIFIMR